MNILVASNDFNTRNLVTRMIRSYLDCIDSLEEASDINTAIEFSHHNKLDLLVVDVPLDKGFELESLLHEKNKLFQTIIISETDGFAYLAFKCQAFDYFLKPINAEKFCVTLTRVSDLRKQDLNRYDPVTRKTSKKPQKLVIPSSEGLDLVSIKEIIYIEGDGHYSSIFTKVRGSFISSKGLREYEIVLPEACFFRVHQSYLINLDKVLKVCREDGGFVLMEGQKKIPIARRRQKEFMEKIMDRFHDFI
ncbi:MAG: response regulator transcription factor [Saprospiraceae bacterium]|nr:response regulator transcription factor [Saprospiraceae bacterium]